MLDHLQVLSLCQTVQTLVPWYNGPMPSQKILEKAVSLNGANVIEYPLKPALCYGLGGQEYITSDVYTKLGHFIDHIFVLRKGGYPVPISFERISKRNLLEDLLVPDDCEVVAVLYLPTTAYTSNTNRLKGPQRLSLNSLKAMGTKVVAVSSASWESLLEQERIPYLMRLLREESQLVCELK